MSNAILLKTLEEALCRTEKRLEAEREQIRVGRKRQRCVSGQLVEAEQCERHTLALQQEVTQEVDVLRTLLGSQGEPSPTLRAQFTVLQQRQLYSMSVVQSVTDLADTIRATFCNAAWQLAGAEQDRAAAQCEWETIAKRITRLSL